MNGWYALKMFAAGMAGVFIGLTLSLYAIFSLLEWLAP